MNIENCCITHYPAAVLTEKAGPVEQITEEIRDLVEKMKDIMVQSGGVGLAGPQAGVAMRIFVASPDGSRENAKVYINPTISLSGSVQSNDEGCLSLPGVHAKIRRYSQCKITATNLDGKEFTEEADGLLARIFQHEFDHLEGTIIVSRMGSVAKIAARRQLRDLKRKSHDEQET